MREPERRRPDLHSLDGADGLEGAGDVLVDDTAEADARVVSKEAQFGSRRQTSLPFKCERRPGKTRIVKKLGKPDALRHMQAVVGVDPEDPVAGRLIEGVVPGRGEVVRPRNLVEPRAMRTRDLTGPVPGPGVHDDDLVDMPL